MTPTHKKPSHVEKEGYSNVFHRDHIGKVVAKFFGENHVADAIEHAKRHSVNQNQPLEMVAVLDRLDTASESELVQVKALLLSKESEAVTPYDQAANRIFRKPNPKPVDVHVIDPLAEDDQGPF